MDQRTSDPNTTGAGYTEIILPTEMLTNIGRRLIEGKDDLNRVDLTGDEKAELLSAIMRAIG